MVYLITLFSTIFLFSCSTVSLTDRKQLIILGDDVIYPQAFKAYENFKNKSASKIIFSLIPYIENHLKVGGKSWDICKHLINLVSGIPKAKIWRNQISSRSIKKELSIDYLIKLTTELQEMGY